MKRNNLLYPGALLVAATLGMVLKVNAGDLIPPAGPISPTMKTLQQVEPRVPIGQTDVPYTIVLPGSYYLTENLVGVGFGNDCITIAADNVTVDLSGFVITPSEVGQWNNGIVTSGALRRNITIKNGTVYFSAADGISATNAQNSQILDVRASNNGGTGFEIGANSTVRNCVSSGNNGRGFTIGLGSTVSGCTASSNTGNGFSFGSDTAVTDCASFSNSAWGFDSINGMVFENCVASLNTGRGFSVANGYSVFKNCYARSNGETGFRMGTHTTVESCGAYGNNTTNGPASPGFVGGLGCTFRGCHAAETMGDSGFHATGSSTIVDCTSASNGDHGIEAAAGSTIRGCTTTSNGLDGINASTGCSVTSCTSRSNGNDGIQASGSLVRGCTTSSNGALGINALLGTTLVENHP